MTATLTVINTTEITPIDRRYSNVARQAAKLLGVAVGDVMLKAHATYDASRHYVEIYDVPAGGMIMLSANNKLLHAAHVGDDFGMSFSPYNECDAFDNNACSAGIVRSGDLNDAYANIIEHERPYGRAD